MGWPLAGPGFISSCVTVESRHLQIRPRSKSSKRMFQIFDTRTISQTHFLEGNSINIAGIPIFVLMNTSYSGSNNAAGFQIYHSECLSLNPNFHESL